MFFCGISLPEHSTTKRAIDTGDNFMIDISDSVNLRYHGEDWAGKMADECSKAKYSIHLSATSLHAPTPNGTGAWPRLWNTWVEAAARAVQVRIWLPAPSPIHPATRGNSTAGDKILAKGMWVHYVTGPRLLHAKTCIIDGEIIWIGSGNFTAAAAHHNHETYLRATCPAIAKQIIERWRLLS